MLDIVKLFKAIVEKLEKGASQQSILIFAAIVLVVGISLKFVGADRAALLAVAAGFVLFLALNLFQYKPSSSRLRVIQQTVATLCISIAGISFLSFPIFTMTYFATKWPCAWAEFAGLGECESVRDIGTISVDRRIDFSRINKQAGSSSDIVTMTDYRNYRGGDIPETWRREMRWSDGGGLQVRDGQNSGQLIFDSTQEDSNLNSATVNVPVGEDGVSSSETTYYNAYSGCDEYYSVPVDRRPIDKISFTFIFPTDAILNSINLSKGAEYCTNYTLDENRVSFECNDVPLDAEIRLDWSWDVWPECRT